ncbi:MAG: type I 3-dehydroquinate dehydratase [Bacteroidota bacterium]
MIFLTTNNPTLKAFSPYDPKEYGIEIRLDYSEMPVSDIKHLCDRFPHCIITFGDILPHKSIIRKYIDMFPGYIDLSLNSYSRQDHSEIIFDNKTAVILSQHCRSFPGSADFMDLCGDCFNYGADIAKIVCPVECPEEANRLMEYRISAIKKYGKEKIAVLGCGTHGKLMRLLVYIDGSPLNYVALSREEITAEGQYTVEEWKNEIRIFE